MTTATATLTAAASPAAAAPAGGATAAPPAGLPTAPAAGWWDSLKDGELKGWAATKNFPDAEKALTSYRNLEQLMGADKAGRTVTLPKDDNDADGWTNLGKKLGVPETADGYKLPFPAGTDDGFAKTAANWFHQAGVPPRAANKIAEAWNDWMAEQVKAGETADRAASDEQMTKLQSEWGGEFEAKKELAQRGYREFAEKFGLSDAAKLERAESVFGAANLTKFFAGLGALNAESKFAGPEGASGGFATTASDAQRQIDQIRTDRMSGKIDDRQWRTEYEGKVLKLAEIAMKGQKAA